MLQPPEATASASVTRWAMDAMQCVGPRYWPPYGQPRACFRGTATATMSSKEMHDPRVRLKIHVSPRFDRAAGRGSRSRSGARAGHATRRRVRRAPVAAKPDRAKRVGGRDPVRYPHPRGTHTDARRRIRDPGRRSAWRRACRASGSKVVVTGSPLSRRRAEHSTAQHGGWGCR